MTRENVISPFSSVRKKSLGGNGCKAETESQIPLKSRQAERASQSGLICECIKSNHITQQCRITPICATITVTADGFMPI